MYKIAVLGEKEVIKGFIALGLDVLACQPGEETVRTLRSIAAREEYAVVYVTESCYASLDAEERERYTNVLIPAVIPIPGPGAGAGVGHALLDDMVLKAIGAKLV
jgi:V/A-type H+-transporting ATPase subunit F